MYATNKRVVGLAGQRFLPEPYRFRVWAVCFGRDRSDPAAHAKHSAQIMKGD